jgi:basic membrane protein A
MISSFSKRVALVAGLVISMGSSVAAFTACQVTDTGGIDDNSFNQTAWKGVLDAKADFGIGGRFLESQAETDYDANINSLIDGDGSLHRDDRRRGWGCGAGAAASGGWKTLR